MRVYKFRVELDEIRPQIWRQIQVPERYTFWELHVTIQDAIGWQDSHLHQFEVFNLSTEQRESIGIPDPELDWDIEAYPGWEYLMADYFTLENPQGFISTILEMNGLTSSHWRRYRPLLQG